MLFITSGVEVSPFVPVFAGFIISFFCASAGISGAFLLLPWQIAFLGYTSPGVSGTNQIFNILACPAGVWRYAREGRMLWQLAIMLASGTLPGVFIGAWLRMTWLDNPVKFKIFAAFILLWIGLRLFRKNKGGLKTPSGSVTNISPLNWHGFSFSYDGQSYCAPFWPLFLMSFIVGIAGGAYGVGGGAIISPFLIALFDLPVHAIAGATLFSTFLTSIAGTAIFSFIGTETPQAAPDWPLGICMGIGGIIGMYLGARMQKHLPAKQVRLGLAILVILLGFSWLFGL